MSSLLFDRAPDAISSEQDGGMATRSKHAVVVEMRYLSSDVEHNGSRRHLSDTRWSSETGSADTAASGSTSSMYGFRLLRAYRHRSLRTKKTLDHSDDDATLSLPLEPERWKQRTTSSSSDDEADVKRLSISGAAEQEPVLPVEVCCQFPVPLSKNQSFRWKSVIDFRCRWARPSPFGGSTHADFRMERKAVDVYKARRCIWEESCRLSLFYSRACRLYGVVRHLRRFPFLCTRVTIRGQNESLGSRVAEMARRTSMERNSTTEHTSSGECKRLLTITLCEYIICCQLLLFTSKPRIYE